MSISAAMPSSSRTIAMAAPPGRVRAAAARWTRTAIPRLRSQPPSNFPGRALNPGRACPLHYRYSPAVFGRDADLEAETLYIVGGLYGNRAALAAVLEMAAREPVAPTLVFNGDFNWFDIADADFRAINEEVLQHIALRGNVETELAARSEERRVGKEGRSRWSPDH